MAIDAAGAGTGAATGAVAGSSFGPIGTVVGAGVGALGSIAGGLISASSQNATNAQNALIAQEQMQFQANQADLARQFGWDTTFQAQDYASQQMAEQERYNTQMFQDQATLNESMAQQQMSYETAMSNTAYQRSVADMKAAGLNPILGVTSGGASTPSVSAPTTSAMGISTPGASGMSSPSPQGAAIPMQNSGRYIGESISSGLNSAISALKLGNDINATQAAIANTNADTRNKDASTAGILSDAAKKATDADTAKVLQQQAVSTLQNLGLTADQIRAVTNANNAQAGQAAANATYTNALNDFLAKNKSTPAPNTLSISNPVLGQVQGSPELVFELVRRMLGSGGSTAPNGGALDQSSARTVPSLGNNFGSMPPPPPDTGGGLGQY